MASILFAFSFIPQVILFVGQMLVSDDGALRYLRDNAEILWQVPVAVALLSLFYATIGIAVSSLASRRIIAGATIIGLFLVTSVVSAILVGPDSTDVDSGSASTANTVIVGPDGQPFEPGDPRAGAGPGDGPTYFIVRTEPSAAPLLNLAGLPLILRDVVFLGELDPGHPMSGLANGGLYAAGVYVLVVGACLGTLRYRYDEVER
jgi:hypothetical protein